MPVQSSIFSRVFRRVFTLYLLGYLPGYDWKFRLKERRCRTMWANAGNREERSLLSA